MRTGLKSKRLSAIETLLDTDDLRKLTDDVLSDLEIELRELIIDFRKSQEYTPGQLILSKQSLLQNLRSASIQLNLAREANETKGRTARHYHYLSACKELLEKAYEQYNNYMIESNNEQEKSYSRETRQSRNEASSPVTLLVRGKSYLRELNDAQPLLRQLYELFSTTLELWPDQCNQALSKLHTIRQSIEGILELLNSTVEFPPGISSLSYELLVKLYQLNEQLRILHSLIISFRSLCQTKSRQLTRMRGEIVSKLEAFENSYADALQAINLFFTHVGNVESNSTRRHRLTLLKPLQ